MFFPRRLVFLLICVAGAPVGSPVLAVSSAIVPRPAPSASQSSWKIVFAEEALENSWSFRGAADFSGDGALRIVFGWKNSQNFHSLQVRRAGGKSVAQLLETRGGVTRNLGAPAALTAARGEIGLQKINEVVRVLWNGRVIAGAQVALSGARFGTATRGAAQLKSDAPQPTERVVFRDDFMRAEGPEQAEVPGEWQVAGVWKTSGTLGPNSDAALNPNPFVFRAQGPTENSARAGKWWWNSYSVSASVRALAGESPKADAPLRAGIEAFVSQKGAGIRGEIDFARGVAKLWLNGVLVAQAPSNLAQCHAALRQI